MSISQGTPISSLETNKRRASALKSLGMVTVCDALTYFPFRVSDPVPLRAIREAKLGQSMAFAAIVRELRIVPMNGRNGYRVEAMVDDDEFAGERNIGGSRAQLVFFSHKKSYVDWLGMRLHGGTRVVVAGDPGEFNARLQFTHPQVLTIAPEAGEPGGEETGRSSLRFDAENQSEALRRVCRPRPVYHASSRISSEHIHESVLRFLATLGSKVGSVSPQGAGAQEADTPDSQMESIIDIDALRNVIPDILPEGVRVAKQLLHRAKAFKAVHDPATTDEFHLGVQTLRYEEAFVSQTSVLQSRQRNRSVSAYHCSDGTLRGRFIASLPFSLTQGQREVIDDIVTDMSRKHPMQRLLQGEVGSGKTVVAVAAMLQAVGAGYQAVLVAPTQVLAEQHAATISAMLGGGVMPTPVPVTLLTGGMKLAARRKALARAASGEPGIVVATHAAFSKTFQAPNLALVVIDEQHRFGVEQRESIREKNDKTPHLLVMTATPIPRTAAMTWFGDLDISWLTELPGGRKPIRTVVVAETDAGVMARMFAHVRSRIDAGERAYVVCPRIDEADEAAEGAELTADAPAGDDGGDAMARDGREVRALHSVAEIAERLSALPQFRGIHFSTLSGRDDDAAKQRVMADFSSGETSVLVATTVIEVGVDVPQASCIVIFDADHYGLSQLHQLRGRVGRGGTDSWAFLVSRAEAGSVAAHRLDVIEHSLDGAEIAQADLELRGAGDVLGDAQSGGQSGLRLLRVVKDVDMIVDARGRAEALLAEDPDLRDYVELAGAVLDFTRGNEIMSQ